LLHIKEAILVEGLYDKQRLKNIVDTCIITTDGFAVYKDKEKMALIRRMAQERGLIILTDSDSAGRRIRNYIKTFVGHRCCVWTSVFLLLTNITDCNLFKV